MCKAIISKFEGRGGNHICQILNTLHYCFIKKGKFKSLQLTHNAYQLEMRILNNYINLEKNNIACNCNKTFNIYIKCSACYCTLNELKSLYMKYMGIDSYKHHQETVVDIGIHIRSGDIFMSNPHSGYVPPPLDFYKQIIIRNPTKSICVVYENELNPIIALLKIFCKETENITFQSSTLAKDIIRLQQCETLVFGVGSFCVMPFVRSNCIKNVIIVESTMILHHFKREITNNFIYITLEQYINPGEWARTDSQMNTLQTYKLNEDMSKLLFLPLNI